MTIQYLEYVLALSRTLNFTKAAAYMHITQPAFSRIIASVEAELGFSIFERNRRSVRLTLAGQNFVDTLEKSLQLYRQAVEKGLNGSSREEQSSITIGYIPDAFNSDLCDIISTFKEAHPDIDILLTETSYFEVYEALSNHDLDMAVYTANLHDLPEGLAFRCLEPYELFVAMNKEHSLASREELQPAELVNEAFIELCYDKLYSKSWTVLQHVGKTSNFTPIVFHQVTTLSSLILQVASGQGIAVVTKPVKAYFADTHRDAVRFVPLDQVAPLHRITLWPPEHENEYICQLVDYISEKYHAVDVAHYLF